jgi:hypothetical protein
MIVPALGSTWRRLSLSGPTMTRFVPPAFEVSLPGVPLIASVAPSRNP